MERFWILISSRVFTVEKAQGYGLTGYVKNTTDGKVPPFRSRIHQTSIPQTRSQIQADRRVSKVIGEAQGDEQDLKSFLKDINDGPKYAHVVKVEKTVMDVLEDESTFEKR